MKKLTLNQRNKEESDIALVLKFIKLWKNSPRIKDRFLGIRMADEYREEGFLDALNHIESLLK